MFQGNTVRTLLVAKAPGIVQYYLILLSLSCVNAHVTTVACFVNSHQTMYWLFASSRPNYVIVYQVSSTVPGLGTKSDTRALLVAIENIRSDVKLGDKLPLEHCR